jgi:hypothetical protein
MRHSWASCNQLPQKAHARIHWIRHHATGCARLARRAALRFRDRHLGQPGQVMPLPPGLNPVEVGRIGLWLLSRRSHRASRRRVAFTNRVWRSSTWGNRFERLITPWRIFEYPGTSAMLAQLCGVSRSTARGWIYGKHLPAQHARQIADYLEPHASQCEALTRELRSYADAADRSRKFRVAR